MPDPHYADHIIDSARLELERLRANLARLTAELHEANEQIRRLREAPPPPTADGPRSFRGPEFL